MPRQTIEVMVEGPKSTGKGEKIKRIKWNETYMMKSESFLATARQIAYHVLDEDLTKIGIIGKSSSGKSTLADAIAHAVHTESDLPWAIRRFEKKHLLDFETTLKTLTPTNHILLFDDLSFLEAKSGRKSIKYVEQAETEIRHLPGGKDVKIILIYNYHYTKGLDKFLRQADFRYFTTVGSEERDNMESIVGRRWMNVVSKFMHCKKRQTTDSKHSYFKSPKLYNGKPFIYNLRNPFIPVLFWDGDALRFIVTPTRQWMQPMCTTCTSTEDGAGNVDIQSFNEQFHKDYPDKGTRRAVITQLLREKGLNCGTKKHIRCRRYLEDAFLKGDFDLEELALTNDVKILKTRNDKKAVVKIDESARSAI